MRFAEAHRFYKHLGYEWTSKPFAKALDPVLGPTPRQVLGGYSFDTPTGLSFHFRRERLAEKAAPLVLPNPRGGEQFDEKRQGGIYLSLQRSFSGDSRRPHFTTFPT